MKLPSITQLLPAAAAFAILTSLGGCISIKREEAPTTTTTTTSTVPSRVSPATTTVERTTTY